MTLPQIDKRLQLMLETGIVGVIRTKSSESLLKVAEATREKGVKCIATSPPHGSPKAVNKEVRRGINDLPPDGGFVFCAVPNLQPDVLPKDVLPKNIVAVYEVALESGSYV